MESTQQSPVLALSVVIFFVFVRKYSICDQKEILYTFVRTTYVCHAFIEWETDDGVFVFPMTRTQATSACQRHRSASNEEKLRACATRRFDCYYIMILCLIFCLLRFYGLICVCVCVSVCVRCFVTNNYHYHKRCSVFNVHLHPKNGYRSTMHTVQDHIHIFIGWNRNILCIVHLLSWFSVCSCYMPTYVRTMYAKWKYLRVFCMRNSVNNLKLSTFINS